MSTGSGFRLVGLLSALVLLMACQVGGTSPTPASKEGYFTWVDESGQVRTSPIKRESRSIEELQSQAGKTPKAQPEPLPPADPLDSVDQASGDERQKADSEFNLANYPDANELEKSGYIRPGDPMPYYTWRDTDGNFRVSYYQPDTRSDVEKGLIRQPITLTPAQVYEAGAATTAPASSTANYPEAFDVLGIDPSGLSYLDRWRSQCCQRLPLNSIRQWSSSREFELDVADSSPTHAFASGVSAYRLVRLPDPKDGPSLIIRARSFDVDGLFVPSLAFLDDSLQPLRLVTNLAAVFKPESWHRQGYTEAFVPAFPGQGERWLLVFTRDEDLSGQTVVETDRGPKVIPHRPTGLLSLTEMQP